MPKLCQLADPDNYRAFPWSFDDPLDFHYWMDLFEQFPAQLETHLREDDLTGPDFETRWSQFCEEYGATLRRWRQDRHADGPITTFTLVYFRQAMLKKYGWPDPYLGVKRRENGIAAELYPKVIRQIDAEPAEVRYPVLLRGVFAGNMFDLGAPATIAMYGSGEADYHGMLARVPDRPWYVDHADSLVKRLHGRRYRQALIFTDNAGSDIVLGVVPLAREMARGGIRVFLAANAEPALNDITIAELNPLLQRLAADDPVLAGLISRGDILTISSGNDTPLIDLGRISEECDAVAAQSDLIVLEGMGRGVESNWNQKFRCDAVKIAMIKDESVARWIGSGMFDAVCRFDLAVA